MGQIGSCVCMKRGPTRRIVMLGLDAAGKTTLLYQMKLHKAVQTTPTVGFNVEDIELHRGGILTTWDVGGQDRLRTLWKYYFKGSSGMIFVLDSADRERLDEAKLELKNIISHMDVKDVPFIILANKQDLPGALSTAQIRDRLSLSGEATGRWSIHPVSGKTADGLDDAIDALAKHLDQETAL